MLTTRSQHDAVLSSFSPPLLLLSLPLQLHTSSGSVRPGPFSYLVLFIYLFIYLFIFNVSFIVISGRTLCIQYMRWLLSVHVIPEHKSRLSDSEHFHRPVSMGTMGGLMDNSPPSSSVGRSVDRT